MGDLCIVCSNMIFIRPVVHKKTIKCVLMNPVGVLGEEQTKKSITHIKARGGSPICHPDGVFVFVVVERKKEKKVPRETKEKRIS